MQISFSYEVCKWNSAMYPGPDLTKLEALGLHPNTPHIPQSPDPGFHEDPIWICSLCHKPVLDDRGKPKHVRAFKAALGQKEPANWCHCEVCCRLSREGKGKMLLLASAKGTTPINKMFDVARAW